MTQLKSGKLISKDQVIRESKVIPARAFLGKALIDLDHSEESRRRLGHCRDVEYHVAEMPTIDAANSGPLSLNRLHSQPVFRCVLIPRIAETGANMDLPNLLQVHQFRVIAD